MMDVDEGCVFVIVCGEINGKNGFGVYVGFYLFFVELNMKLKGMFLKGVDYMFGKYFLSLCEMLLLLDYIE